jgi:DNA polymerase III epsilon subunit-like protein
MNYNKICVFDFETDGSNPQECSPVQLAAVMVDPINLEIIQNSEFSCNFKPEVMQKEPEYEYTTDILDFHAKVKGCSKDQVYAEWQNYPNQKVSWKMFVDYLDKYHTRNSKKSQFSAPIAAGYNIYRFDLAIIERLSKKNKNINKEGNSNIFYPRDVVDVINLVFYWFSHNNELKSYKLDTLRDYFGITKDGAHDAIKDVKDTADILIRFLKLHRTLSEKIKFKGAFKAL